MIQRLANTNVSFKGNEVASPRETYDSQIAKNSQMAQKQTNIIMALLNQIPMQGVGQKLDVIA